MSIESVIKKLKSALKEAEEQRDFILNDDSGKTDIRYKISSSILNKLIVLTENMLSDNGEFVRDFSSLRYTLEALITVKLFEKDEKHMLVTYYSLFNKQIELMEKIINRLKNEMNLYEKLAVKEDCLEESISSSEISRPFEEIKNLIDDELHSEITIFSENIETNGYSHHKSHLETKILPLYEERINYLNKQRDERANELLSNSLFKKHFPNIKNANEIFESIKSESKHKSWKEKAKETLLIEEYEYIYNFTSAIIHCDSYSFVTKSNFDENERSLIIKMQSQYLKKITESIKNFLSKSDCILQIEIMTPPTTL